MTTKKTSTELVPQALHDELKTLSGETNAFTPRHNFPQIKIDLVKKIFIRTSKDSIGDTVADDVGATFSAPIIRIRRRLTGWDGDTSYYSYEFDNAKDHVKLFCDGVVLSEGTAKEIKSDMASKGKDFIKEQNVLYVLLDGTVYKMYVKGSSLSNLFEFLQNKGNDALASFETEFSFSEQKKGSVVWQKMDFKKGGPSDVKTVIEKLKELNSYLIAVEMAADSFNDSERSMAGALGMDKKQLNEAKKSYESGGTIDPSKINFS
jgi:hypothetical protein